MDRRRGEVAAGWEELHSEELHNLYSSPSAIKMPKSRMRWSGNVARLERRGMHTGGKVRRGPLGSARRRREGNTGMGV
jgi:hypothetical protein